MTIRLGHHDLLLDEGLCAYAPDLSLLIVAADAGWLAQYSLFPEWGWGRFVDRLGEMRGLYGAERLALVVSGDPRFFPESPAELASDVYVLAARPSPPLGKAIVIERLEIGGLVVHAEGPESSEPDCVTFGGLSDAEELRPSFALRGETLLLPWFAGLGSSRPVEDPEVRILDL
jgi:hypothetical protein